MDFDDRVRRTIAEQHDEIEALRAENERLRNTLVQYGLFESIIGDPAEEFAKLRLDLHRLQRENTKLCDLVRKMRYGATWTREAREYIEVKMRELGITEVDA